MSWPEAFVCVALVLSATAIILTKWGDPDGL